MAPRGVSKPGAGSTGVVEAVFVICFQEVRTITKVIPGRVRLGPAGIGRAPTLADNESEGEQCPFEP